MREVHEDLVPDGPVALQPHRDFLGHLAAMHVAFWGFPAEHQAGLLEPATVTRR